MRNMSKLLLKLISNFHYFPYLKSSWIVVAEIGSKSKETHEHEGDKPMASVRWIAQRTGTASAELLIQFIVIAELVVCVHDRTVSGRVFRLQNRLTRLLVIIAAGY